MMEKMQVKTVAGLVAYTYTEGLIEIKNNLYFLVYFTGYNTSLL